MATIQRIINHKTTYPPSVETLTSLIPDGERIVTWAITPTDISFTDRLTYYEIYIVTEKVKNINKILIT